jgi:gliding motility-associated-like protein
VNGAVVTTLNAGQSFNYAMGAAGAAYIQSSSPVYVLQMSGFGCEVGLSILPPIICTGSQRISFARSNAESLFLVLLVEAGGEGNFLLNGAAGVITPANFSFVPGTANGWMYAQLTIPTATVAAGGTGVVTNSTNFFHLGMIHGSAGGGCRFGYFSDFAKYKYQIQSNDEVFCAGDSIVLATNVLPGATYEWAGPNGFSAVGDTLMIVPAALADAGQYIISGNLPNACELLPDSIDITVIESPEPPLIYTNGPVCENDSLLFWNEVAAPYTFTWNSVPGGGSNSNDTVLVYPALVGTYSVEMTVSLGTCESPPSTLSAEVLELPTVTYSGLTDVCGDTVDLLATYTTDPLDDFGSVTWLNQNNTLLGTSIPLLAVEASSTPEVMDSFVVVFESQNGCMATDTFAVDFHPSPAVDFDWTDLCDASTILYQNNTGWVGNPDPTDSLSYVLNFGDGNTSIIPDTAYTYENAGTYSVVLVAENEFGCVDSLVQQVEVPSLPSPTLSIDDGCGLVGFSATIDNGSFPLESLSWTVDGSVLSTAPSFSYAFNEAGAYNGTLVLSGANDCSFPFPFVFTVISSIGLEELQIPNVITANGDGINDVLVLNELFTNCTSYTMEFVNRWGGLVYTQSNDSLPFGGKTDKGDELYPGVYFYILRTEEGSKHGHVTIIR